MAYPVGTRIKLIQEDGLFNIGVILERVTVEPYSVSGRRGHCNEGWKVVKQPEEGIGWAVHLPMLEQVRIPDRGPDYIEYTFKYPVEEEREGVAFEISDELLVGDRVYIHPDSNYYGLNAFNPRNIEGTVVSISNLRLPISVEFSNGGVNNYRTEDLELSSIREARESERKALASFSLRGRIKDTIKEMGNAPFNGHTRYAIISASPLWFQGIEHGACHAAVNRSEVPNRFCIISSINFRKVKERGCTNEDIIVYYDWLFNRSPLRSAFLTKKADKALDRGYVITSCKPAANLMQSANVALRQPWEQHSIVVDVFAGLVRAGVNENLAFVLSHYVNYDRNNPTLNSAPGGMHRVFDWNMASKESVSRWINDELTNRTESYRTNNNFSGGDNLIAMQKGEQPFCGHDILTKFPAPEFKNKETTHVFASAKSGGVVKAVSLNARIEWLASWHREFEEQVVV